MFGICEAKNGTETDELLQTGTGGHQRIWQNAENDSKISKKEESQPRRQRIGELREKEHNYEKGVSEGGKQDCNGRFNGAKRHVEPGKWRKSGGRGQLPNEEGDAVKKYKVLHEENFMSKWPREEERGKEERTAKAEKNEEERGDKRKREEEKRRERNGDCLKKLCGFCFCGSLLNFWSRERSGELW